MKVIDEKGKIFGKINIFDLFVLLALVIIIGLVGYKIIDKKRQSNNQIPTKTYIVTVKSFEMPPTYTEALKKDNRIYYDIDKFVNAKIIDIREEPEKITVQTPDGQLIEVESDTLQDVTIDLEVEDSLTTDDIRIGRYAVAVGGRITVKTIYAMGADSLVLDIREK